MDVHSCIPLSYRSEERFGRYSWYRTQNQSNELTLIICNRTKLLVNWNWYKSKNFWFCSSSLSQGKGRFRWCLMVSREFEHFQVSISNLIPKVFYGYLKSHARVGGWLIQYLHHQYSEKLLFRSIDLMLKWTHWNHLNDE